MNGFQRRRGTSQCSPWDPTRGSHTIIVILSPAPPDEAASSDGSSSHPSHIITFSWRCTMVADVSALHLHPNHPIHMHQMPTMHPRPMPHAPYLYTLGTSAFCPPRHLPQYVFTICEFECLKRYRTEWEGHPMVQTHMHRCMVPGRALTASAAVWPPAAHRPHPLRCCAWIVAAGSSLLPASRHGLSSQCPLEGVAFLCELQQYRVHELFSSEAMLQARLLHEGCGVHCCIHQAIANKAGVGPLLCKQHYLTCDTKLPQVHEQNVRRAGSRSNARRLPTWRNRPATNSTTVAAPSPTELRWVSIACQDACLH